MMVNLKNNYNSALFAQKSSLQASLNNSSGYVKNSQGQNCYMGIPQFQTYDTFQNSRQEKYKKAFKKSLIISLALFAASLSSRMPLIVKELKKEYGKFNGNAVLSSIPTDAEIADLISKKAKNIVSSLGFDEANIDKSTLKDAIKNNFLVFHSDNVDELSDLVLADKNKLRILNLIAGHCGGKGGKYFYSDILDIIKKLPKDFSEDDLKVLFEKRKSKIYSFNFADCIINCKEINKLDTIIEKFTQNCPKDMKETKYVPVNYLFEDGKLKNGDEMVKFLSSIKKGTMEREWSNSSLLNLLEQDNLRQIRKFYSSLNDDALRKIRLCSISDFLNLDGMNSVEVSNYINNLPKATLKKFRNTDDMLNYINFRDFIGIRNINELDMSQKRKLIQKLVRVNSSSFGSDNKFVPIMPKNQQEYCALLQKLSKSIGVNTKPLTQKELGAFNSAIEKLSKEIQNIDLNNVTLGSKISREDFTKSAEDAMKGLSDIEKRKVMDYFGFEIKDGILKGYPLNVNNGQKLSEIKNVKTKNVVEKLRPIVAEYIDPVKNPITATGATPAFEREFNEVLKGMPELRPMIAKAQHETHAFTLDIHTLKVLQNVCANPKFENLSNSDKKILEIASLLHDITKQQGARDIMHPVESAFDAYYIIQKLDLSESEQLKVYELIRSHNWLQRLNDPANKDMIENIAQDIAFDSRHTNTFELAKILCEADLKSVKKDSSFFNKHKRSLDIMSAKVDEYLKRIKETQIFLPQTKIPKASQIKGAAEASADGIKNKVIYIDDVQNDLSQLGFEQGTTKENLRALVHALEYPEQMSKFDTFSAIDTEALLSSSYMNAKEYKVFRKQGVILDVNTNDIHAGYYSDFGTGYSKDIELLKIDYLFKDKRKDLLMADAWRGDRTLYRNYISDQIKRKMNLSNEEYISYMEKIQSCKSISDIEKVDKKFADALEEVFNSMDAGKRRGGRAYNEMLVTRPKVQGVFAYDKPYERIPKFLRKYAQDNDMPILIFGKH